MYSPARARSPRIAAFVVAGVLVLAIGVWLGGHPSWMPSGLRSAFTSESSQGRLTDQVLDMIAKDYYRPISRNQLLNKGLAAAVASLDDPYSHYFDPSDYNQFQTQSNPHVSGVGIDVMTVSQGLKVVDVFPGTPAAQAGIRAGDLITAVGATSLAGRSATAATNLITGDQGTRVTLMVQSGSQKRTVVLKRANVLVTSGGIVDYHGVKIGDLRLTSFTEGSGAALRAQVDKVVKEGAQALILDLRDNGGGLLDEAVNIASIFIPDGTIVTTRGRSQPTQVYTAKGGAISTKIPMVVLVDRGTASAAEIVTGALKDRDRAKVVGTNTYGKGVFQEIQPLSNGGALDITVGEYFTPNGQNLGAGGVKEGKGITPNVYALDNPHTTRDEALVVAERTVAAELQ
jgi:carboxyl-terminal processing protease